MLVTGFEGGCAEDPPPDGCPDDPPPEGRGAAVLGPGAAGAEPGCELTPELGDCGAEAAAGAWRLGAVDTCVAGEECEEPAAVLDPSTRPTAGVERTTPRTKPAGPVVRWVLVTPTGR